MMIHIRAKVVRAVCCAVRDRSKATRQELAALLDVSVSTLSKWERPIGSHTLIVHDYFLESLAQVSRQILGNNGGVRLLRRLSESGTTEGRMIPVRVEINKKKGGTIGRSKR